MGASQSRGAHPATGRPTSKRHPTPDVASSDATVQSSSSPQSNFDRNRAAQSTDRQSSLRRSRESGSDSAQSSDSSTHPSSIGHPDRKDPDVHRSRSFSRTISPFIPGTSRDKGKGRETSSGDAGSTDKPPALGRSKSSLISIFKGGKEKERREKKRRRIEEGGAERFVASEESPEAEELDSLTRNGREGVSAMSSAGQVAASSIRERNTASPALEPSTEASQVRTLPLEEAATLLPEPVTGRHTFVETSKPDMSRPTSDVDMDAHSGLASYSGVSLAAEAPIDGVGDVNLLGPALCTPSSPSLGSASQHVLLPNSSEHEEAIHATSAVDLYTANDQDRSRAMSPPIIPLTTADPLISDRLSALSAIRDVLGDEVLRSLPAVRDARASLDLERRTSRTSMTGLSQVAGEGAVILPPGVVIPADTRSLLETLEDKEEQREVRDAADAAMAVDETLSAPLQPAHLSEITYEETPHNVVFGGPSDERAHPSAISATPLATMSQDLLRPSLASLGPAVGGERDPSRHPSSLSMSSRNRDREGQLGRVASRLSGWLGLNGTEGSNSDSTNAADGNWSAMPSVHRARSGATRSDSASSLSPRPSSSTLPTPEPNSSSGYHDDRVAARIRAGATLIIQGFVQTSIPTPASSATRPSLSRSNTIHGDDNSSGMENTVAGGSEDNSSAVHPPTTSNRSTLRRRQSAGELGGRVRRDGLFGRSRVGNAAEAAAPPAFAQQAQMLGGLLSVATAATAASLLTPPGQPSPLTRPAARSPGTARGALDTIRNRLRNGTGSDRSNISDTMDESLREYMRHAMDPDRTWSDAGREAPQGGYVAGPDGPVPAPDTSGPSPVARSRLRALLPNTDSDAFEEFLDSMQVDLSRQLREHVGEVSPANSLPSSTSRTVAADDTLLPAASGSMDIDPASVPLPGDEEDEMEIDDGLTTQEEPAAQESPRLHHFRPGIPYPSSSILHDAGLTARASAVDASNPEMTDADASGPSEEPPRRFNFFRMFQFPVREQEPANGLPATTTNPMESLIPVLIIGVRSMNRDISTMSSGDAANSPFMFGDEEDGAEAAGTGGSGMMDPSPLLDASGTSQSPYQPVPSSAAVAEASPAVTEDRAAEEDTRPGGWGSRALRAFGRHRRNEEADRRARGSLLSNPSGSAASGPASSPTPELIIDPSTRNYVLWVFGGHYPPGHPILTIPQLFTGVGDLTHDDLWALAEALGQVKPPTASKDDIKKSGLEEIKGDKVGLAVQEGKVLENCLERCLICLGDYEPEEDCRIMSCKHAFHSPCIDHWLEVGRNSCPACRQAGVHTSATGPAEPSAGEAVPVTRSNPAEI